MMKKIIYTVILFTASLSVYSQDSGFSGKITNKKNIAVPFATVYLLNTSQGTLSDIEGNYTFKKLPAGRYEVQVSSVGFTTMNRQVMIEKAVESSAVRSSSWRRFNA